MTGVYKNSTSFTTNINIFNFKSISASDLVVIKYNVKKGTYIYSAEKYLDFQHFEVLYHNNASLKYKNSKRESKITDICSKNSHIKVNDVWYDLTAIFNAFESYTFDGIMYYDFQLCTYKHSDFYKTYKIYVNSQYGVDLDHYS